ncbi:MAG: dihydroorotate dehydrogenase electron transfer subunit [Planctomycetota bacterium]
MTAPTPETPSPLHAAYYADGAAFVRAPVLENVPTARDTFRMRVEAPEIARQITPGQFVMVRIAGLVDPLLGRAFALYDVVANDDGNATAFDFVYLKKGNLTTPLSALSAGQEVEVWGPLGNGFHPRPTDHLIMVAGGIGYTPMLALGKESLSGAKYGAPPRPVERVPAVTMCYGVRTADLLSGAQDFRGAGIDLRVASDDGSIGHHGLVTDVLESVLDESPAASPRVVCCGPEPMMQAVAEICGRRGVACEVSLETPMACGLGVCFSCVAKVRQEDGEWDYKRTCVEGPVFDAEKIVW